MKKNRSTIILILIFLVGLSVMLYPTVSDYVNQRHQSRALASYDETVNEMSDADYTAYFEAADAYNQRLAATPNSFFTPEQVSGYDETLDVSGTGIMGYITIPRIGVELPVYHGTSDGVLQVAAGHLEGSSLPIGGENSHAVISAHRGLPSASLFTDLDKLELGDHFLIHVLDETLAYEVDDIQVVEPEDTESLAVEPDEDLVTLLTCTPYGVNSHRLLVQGHRVSYDPETTIAKEETKGQVSMHTNYLLWVIVGLAVTAAFIAGLFLWDRKQKKKMENTATPKE